MSHTPEHVRFRRKYILRIALNPNIISTESEDKVDNGTSAGGTKKPSAGDLLTLPAEAIEITDLHIEATINYKKTTKAASSPARIDIYNLSRATLAKIKPESTIILQAGYETDKELPIVFAGQIVTVATSRRNVDKITTILAGGAYTVQKNLRMSGTIPKGSTYKQAIQLLLNKAAEYGLPTGAFRTDPQEVSKESKNKQDKLKIVLEDGYAVSGWLMNSLNDLCSSIGYRTYISVGKIYVEPKEFSKTLELFTITSEVVIGDIQLKTDSSSKLSGSTTHKSGITVKILVDGRLTLDKKIRIPEGEYSGVYDIAKLDHKLSYEEADWFSTMDLTYLGSVR